MDERISSRQVATPGEDIAAIRGEAVPFCLGPPSSITRRCVVRGIRYNDGFASELHRAPELPEITRALNARAIMSNRVAPDMAAAEFPYCFWHPDLPTRETLRELLKLYPEVPLVQYQVGRVCAAAGYTDLYQELDILPDVSIAEEARDNGAASQAIYDDIMERSVKYACMDDYNLVLKSKLSPARLNADSCVRSMLDKKQPRGSAEAWKTVFPPALVQPVFDITEDWSVDVEGMRPEERPIDIRAMRLLYNPLPDDLPIMDKDVLILMAALNGEIDRYHRLRRPGNRRVRGEYKALVWGIYHHPLFAKYCLLHGPDDAFTRQAVYARLVASNELSWIDEMSPPVEHLPEVIWFPKPAHWSTYLELARRLPVMRPQIAYACIEAGYEDLFRELDVTPDLHIWEFAQRKRDPRLERQIQARAGELGIDLDDLRRRNATTTTPPMWEALETWLKRPGAIDSPAPARLDRALSLLDMDPDADPDQDFEFTPLRVGRAVLHAIAPDPLRPVEPFEYLALDELYADAPYLPKEEGEGEGDRGLIGLYPNVRWYPDHPYGGSLRGRYRGPAGRRTRQRGRDGGR